MNLLQDLLSRYVGTSYVIAIHRTDRIIERGAMIYGAPPLPPKNELLARFHRAPQPPQGGDAANEVTAASLKREYGPGLYLVSIIDGDRCLGTVGVEVMP